MYKSLFWFVLVVFLPWCNLYAQEIETLTYWYHLGEDSVAVITYIKPSGSHVFIHVHENEVTSLAAGKQLMERFGGKLVTLQHTKDGEYQRNITFKYQGKKYQIDPNRIFTEDTNLLISNIELVKGKGQIPADVQTMVKGFASFIWQQIRGYDLIIALHNNKNEPASYKRRWLFWFKYEPDSYSVMSYIKAFGQSSESNLSCSDIYINPAFNNSEFFIVTQRQDFDILFKASCSVVLQNQTPVDDGSLSVYALKNRRRYINCEAKHGNLQEQVELLTTFFNVARD
jgi:hypothetical protein